MAPSRRPHAVARGLPDRSPDRALAEGLTITAGGRTLRVIHTPGHSPGGCCLYDEAGAVLFSGDTLFRGGPGATGRSYSDFPTIIASIRDRLLVLPDATRALTGHGEGPPSGRRPPIWPSGCATTVEPVRRSRPWRECR